MAIEKLALSHSDFHTRGGVQYIGITDFSDIIDASSSDYASSLFTNTAGNHAVSLQQASTGDDVVFHLFEAKQGTASFTQTGSKDGSTIMYEQTLTFFAPNVKDDSLSAIEKLGNEQLCVVFLTYANEAANPDVTKAFVMGVSEKYKDSSDHCNAKHYARLSSVEVSTGAALGDDNGVTVTLTCTSGELVRSTIASEIAIDSSAGTLTIAKA